MKFLYYLGAIPLFFVLGITLFLVKRNWMIVHWVPSYRRSDDISGVLNKKIAPKKKINLYFFKGEALKKEEVSLVWLSSKAEILKLIIGNWLTLVYEERILAKRVRIESVALASFEQEAYVSFDQVPFLQESSIHKKMQLLNALRRTIDSSGLGIQSLVFLVRHEPMVDDHLDFSQPWPVG